MTKTAEKPYPLAAHTYIADIREYPPPPAGVSILLHASTPVYHQPIN